MRTLKQFLIAFISVVGFFVVILIFNPFEAAQSARSSGSASGTVVGIGSVSFGDSGKCGVPPTWKGEIRGKKRWVPTYFDKKGKPHAFCDRQTGIVIQRTPGTPGHFASACDNGSPCTWDAARGYCANLTVGESGQKGWRLLYMPELAALVYTNLKSCTSDYLCLPDGHPFKDGRSAEYWSASPSADDPTGTWIVSFFAGVVRHGSEVGLGHAWCGRGATDAAVY